MNHSKIIKTEEETMPKNNIAIGVKNVSKVYRLGSKDLAEDSLLKSLSRTLKSPIKNYQ